VRLMTANGSDSVAGTEVANAGGSTYAPQSVAFPTATGTTQTAVATTASSAEQRQHRTGGQQFRALPIWLDEGCAVYFSFPAYMRDAHDDLALRSRWYVLRKWLTDGQLPDLHQFLDLSPQEFRKEDPARTYPVSWSVFQLLMSTPENRRALNVIVAEYQKPAPKEPDCAELLNKFYPGGLVKMDKDWRAWIARGAANLLGSQ